VIADDEGFSALPGAVARELESRRRVVVILLDAFGWSFVQRHAQHPLLARVARDGTLAPMASQFPSTTTAHVTTMHTGLPVADHGLYEWRVWEPKLGRVVIPLLAHTLQKSGFDPRELLPQGPSFYQRLAARGIPSLVFSPDRFSPSAYDRAAIRGAPLTPYGELADGARALAAAVAEQDRCVRMRCTTRSRGCQRRSATGGPCTAPARCSRRPVRDCASAWPRSASCPLPAAWPGSRPTPTTSSCASAATTANARPKRRRRSRAR
jgi:Type I phosphodiesterase / nucleotide pyrophosphatase